MDFGRRQLEKKSAVERSVAAIDRVQPQALGQQQRQSRVVVQVVAAEYPDHWLTIENLVPGLTQTQTILQMQWKEIPHPGLGRRLQPRNLAQRALAELFPGALHVGSFRPDGGR